MEEKLLTSEQEREIISTLKGMRKFDNSTRSKLSQLGFSVIRGKKHIKIRYKDVPHTFFTSSTGSDVRNGLNLAKDIIRTLNRGVV